MIVKRNKQFSFFDFFRKKEARRQREEDQLKKEEWKRDITAHIQQVESIKIDEPLTYKELCNKYPKFKELDYIVRNEKSIIDLIEKIAPHDIFQAVDNLTIFTGTDQTPKEYRRRPEGVIKFLQNELKSADWLPCFDHLIYNKKSNKFYYYHGKFVNNGIPKPITISQYCKDIVNDMEEYTLEELDIETDNQKDFDVEKYKKSVKDNIQKLRRILRI